MVTCARNTNDAIRYATDRNCVVEDFNDMGDGVKCFIVWSKKDREQVIIHQLGKGSKRWLVGRFGRPEGYFQRDAIVRAVDFLTEG